MAEYYTKKDQVPLKSGEKLGFSPGRGYYAIPAPAKTSAPAKTTSTEELGGLSVSQVEQIAGSYGLTTTATGDEGAGTSSSTTRSTSTPPTKHPTQPTKAPTAAAKTPTAAEAAAKSMITDAYRPVVFKTATKAKPNAALMEAAHRQGGTVAHPITVAKTTKPATANAKKNASKSVKAATTTTSKKTSTSPAAKHAAAAAAATFYTYKKDVHLKPGQSLAYTPGKGYYARGSVKATGKTEVPVSPPKSSRVSGPAGGITRSHGAGATQQAKRVLAVVTDAKQKAGKPSTSTVALKKQKAVVTIAENQKGRPYTTGGASPSTGFDCSGLVQWAFAQIGIALPRTSETQYAYAQRYGTRIPQSKLQPGDLVFYRGDGTYAPPGHVGVYVGHGEVMQALSHRYGVGVWPVNFVSGYMGAYRVIKR